jgi:hypothetical protein
MASIDQAVDLMEPMVTASQPAAKKQPPLICWF